MRIVQTVFGAFWHFELARELERRGHLDTIYSTWPWWRLKREGLAKSFIRTFPPLHLAELLCLRSPLNLNVLADNLGYANALAFDSWTLRQIRGCQLPDALIAISGSSLKTGRWLQKEGCLFICDRGSTHQRFQNEILSDEYARWGLNVPVSDPRDTAREEEIYNTADAITVLSTFASRSFISMGLPADKVHTIPLGVRLDSIFRPGTPPSLSERFEVVFAGQVGLRKGIPYLLEAFARVRHPHKRLRIVGSVMPGMKPIIARLPTNSVEFVGSVPQQSLASIMASSHVLVLPSIEDGFGMVLSQAMACGCPVIASTNTGGEDLLADGIEGFIVPIRDVTVLANRLQQLLDEPDVQKRQSQAAIARVQSLGGWRQYGDSWEALLERLTGTAKVEGNRKTH